MAGPGSAGRGWAGQGFSTETRSRHMRIKLTEIVCDESLYPRKAVNPYFVHRMIEALESGSEFPAVVVEQSTGRLVDGWHRHQVYLAKGIKDIEAIGKSYLNDSDFFADAVQLNTEHGIPLTAYDLRNAVARLEKMGYQRDAISKVVKLPVDKIAEISKGFGTSESGDPVALKGGLSHMQGQQLSQQQITAQKHYGGHKAVFYVRQLILLLNEDLWPRDELNFRQEMDRLMALWEGQATTEKAA
jgi:hypothetical protein